MAYKVFFCFVLPTHLLDYLRRGHAHGHELSWGPATHLRFLPQHENTNLTLCFDGSTRHTNVPGSGGATVDDLSVLRKISIQERFWSKSRTPLNTSKKTMESPDHHSSAAGIRAWQTGQQREKRQFSPNSGKGSRGIEELFASKRHFS